MRPSMLECASIGNTDKKYKSGDQRVSISEGRIQLYGRPDRVCPDSMEYLVQSYIYHFGVVCFLLYFNVFAIESQRNTTKTAPGCVLVLFGQCHARKVPTPALIGTESLVDESRDEEDWRDLPHAQARRRSADILYAGVGYGYSFARFWILRFLPTCTWAAC